MTRVVAGSCRPVRTVYLSLNLAQSPSARLSRISPACRVASRSVHRRGYSSKGPKEEQDGDKPVEGQKPGKAAPGFENLYDQSSMKAQGKPAEDGENSILRTTLAEQKLIDEMTVVLKTVFPKAHTPELLAYLEHCKRTGVTPPLQEVLDLHKENRLMSISSTFKIARLQKVAEELSDEQTASAGSSQEASDSTQADGKFTISAEDEKVLNDMIEKMKRVLPASVAKDAIPFFQDCKKNGIPPELRDAMNVSKQGNHITLANIMKVVRLAVKITETQRTNPNESGSGKESSTGQKDGTSKEKPGTHDSGKGNLGGSGQGSGGKGGSGGPGGGFKFDMNTLIISLFTTYITWKVITPSEASKDITWQEFNTAFLQNGLVEKLVVLNEKRVKVFLHRESLRAQHPDSPAVNENFFYYFTIGSVEAFERKMEDVQDDLGIPTYERIPVSYERGGEGALTSLMIQLIPTALLLGGLFYISRRGAGGGGGGGGIFGMGKSRAKKFNHETDIKVKFADVAGMDEAKVEIMEFVSFLKQPERFQKLGAKIPRGAILSGPPGTGKTLLAKATAGESGVPFFSVSGAEFVEIFVGVGPSRVRDLFANARKNTPCIIFIDEIDAIGRARGKNNFSGGNDEREATLNQILTEMDGFNTSEQVVVLAGTNRPDILDSALMRPGRFDRNIAIDRPTMEGRKQIFQVHLKKIVTDEDMEHLTGRLAALTPGFSGADIANCANEAALIAARENADKVRMKHFEAAIERTIGGLEKKSLVLSPEEKRVVAYHEAGHAICGWFFKYADPLLKVSIIPRGQGALGYAQYLPAGDTYLMNEFQFMDRMAMTLGGRVSEELHFDTVTSGASDDFNKVTRMATAMVTKYGMSEKIGRVYYEDDNQQALHKPFSEQTAREIDVEVKRIADRAYKQCRDLLTEKKKEVGLVAEELLKKEMLVRDDLIRLLGRRPFEDKAEFEKYFSGGLGAGQKSAPPPPPQESQDLPFPGDSPPPVQPAMKQHEGENKA